MIAIILLEELGAHNNFLISVLATEDDDALNKAMSGYGLSTQKHAAY